VSRSARWQTVTRFAPHQGYGSGKSRKDERNNALLWEASLFYVTLKSDLNSPKIISNCSPSTEFIWKALSGICFTEAFSINYLALYRALYRALYCALYRALYYALYRALYYALYRALYYALYRDLYRA
jgi:hypothetical protein